MPGPQMYLSTPIIQIVARDPVSLDVNAKFSEAAALLAGGSFHHLPIVDGKVLVGIMSANDIVGLSSTLGDGSDEASRNFIDRNYSIADLMTTDPITISDRATFADAAQKLSAGGFHCLPIVDHRGQLVGVVTTTDLVGYMLDGAIEQQHFSANGERIRALESVYEAAQMYLHSGLAEDERSRLEAALEDVRETAAA